MAIFISGVGYSVNPSPLAISEGGTGQSTAPTAINALLPTQSGQTGKFLTTDGANVSWATAGGGGTPGGSTTQIQYNNAGAFAGSSRFTWDNTATAPVLTLTSNSATTATITAGDSGGQNHLRVKAGTPASGDGGNLYLNATDCGTSTSNGGDVSILAGRTGLNAASAGSVFIRSGSAPSSSTTGFIQLSNTVNDTPTPRLTINYNGSWSLGAAGTNQGTSGQVLTSNGTTTAPTWQNVSAATATNISGGATGRIPYQTAVSTTGFVSALTYDGVATITLGDANQSASLFTTSAGNAANSLIIRPGNSTVQRASDMYVGGGTGGAGGGYIYMQTAGSTTLANRLFISNNGNVVVGNGTALGTAAARGYLFISAGAGAPGTTPIMDDGLGTAGVTNVPLHADTTNNSLYFYSTGAWRTAGGIPATIAAATTIGTVANANVSLTAFAGTTSVGSFSIVGATATGANTAGSLILQAGSSSSSGAGGSTTIAGGDVTSGTGVFGGALALRGGNQAGNGVAGGPVTINGGNSTNGSTSGAGGAVTISGGTSVTAAGGAVNLQTNAVTRLSIANGGVITASSPLAAAGGGAALVGTPAIRISNNQFVTFLDAAAGTTNCGGIWQDGSNILSIVSGNAVRLGFLANGAWSVGAAGTNTGTSGQVLTSAGSGAPPTWAAAPASANIAAATTIGTVANANVSLTAFAGTTSVGSFSILGATATGANTAGSVIIQAGSSSTNGAGGATTVAGGDQTAGTGQPTVGTLLLRGGDQSGNGQPGGAVTLRGGNNSNNGVGGAVTITGGTGITGGGFLSLQTAPTTTLTERLRILNNGAWSVGTGGAATGTSGQVLTSTGSTTAPTWQTATAATATNIAAGATNQIPYQSAASTTAFSSELTFTNSTKTLTLGTAGTGILLIATGTNATGYNLQVSGSGAGNAGITVGASGIQGTIAGWDVPSGATPGSDLLVRAGTAASTNAGGNLILSGGTTGANGGTGGYITLNTAPTATSSVTTERLRILANGAWSVGTGGAATGTSGQILTSTGSTTAPTWQNAAAAAAGTLTGSTLAAGVTASSLTSIGVLTGLDVNADSIIVRTAKTPATATDTGVTGQIAWDSNFVYVCVATNTWKKTAIATW